MAHRLDEKPARRLDAGLRLDSAVVPPGPPSVGAKKHMAELALGLDRKNLDQKMTLGASMVSACTDNPNTPGDNPVLALITAKQAAITAKRKDIVAAQTALDNEEAALAQLEQEHDELLVAEKKHLESVTRGDRAKLSTVGAPLKGEAAPIGPLPAPRNLRLTSNDHEGGLDAMCDTLDGARMWIFRYATTPNGPWTQGYMGTQSRCTILGLSSGQEYFVQAQAIGTAGPSPWSDLARKRAS